MTVDSSTVQPQPPPPYLGFGIAGLGTGLVVQAPILLLLIYMTDTLAIPAALAGLAMFGPKLFDVITDPVMGFISDRTSTRWGRRRPYLLAGGLVVGVSMCFLFATPLYDSMYMRLGYVIVFYVIVQTGVTIFMVPYYAMPAEMTDNRYERTKLMSARAVFSFSGILIGGVLALWLVLKGGGGREGYALMSIVVALICGGSFVAACYGTRNARFAPRDEQVIPLKQQVKIALANRPFNIFMLSFLVYIAGMGCFVAAVPYYARYILAAPDALSTLWLYIQLPAIVSIPIWTIATRKLEKKSCYIVALGLMLLGSSSFFLADSGSLATVWTICVLFGLGFGGTQVTVWAMLPDVIEWDRWSSGMERGGIFAGGMTAFEKSGFALGGLITGSVLGWFHYAESAGNFVTQPDSALWGIKIATGMAPGIGFVVAALIISAYPLTHEVLQARAAQSLTAATAPAAG